MCFVLFFKQKTADEMRISDWSADVCSSDLATLWAGALTDASMNAMRVSALRRRAARAAAPTRVRGLVTAMRRACPCAAARDPSPMARRGARAPGRRQEAGGGGTEWVSESWAGWARGH